MLAAHRYSDISGFHAGLSLAGSSWAYEFHPAASESILEELVRVEDLLSAEHVVDRAGELGGDDGKGLTLAVSSPELWRRRGYGKNFAKSRSTAMRSPAFT